MTIKQTGFLKDLAGNYIPKDPQANLQYGVDWRDWLAPGDNLLTSTWQVESTATNAIESTTPFILDNVALVTLTGGVEGEIYTIANTITTDKGWQDVRRFRVKVERRYIK